MLFDSHVHTKFSADSETAGIDAYQAARNKGMGVVFTEHMDFNLPPSRFDFSFDAKKYMDEYGAMRGMYLLLGAEIGLGRDCVDKVKEFSTSANFDVVIGSIHVVDGFDIYEKNFYEGKTKEEAYESYLSLMLDMVKQNPFIDVLGHIDYICRYAPYDDKAIDLATYGGKIDEILKALLDANIILELNTRRFTEKGAPADLKPIYSRYKELGGKYVTIGSDAHTAENVGHFLAEGEALAKECGLETVIFYERQLMPLSADGSGC